MEAMPTPVQNRELAVERFARPFLCTLAALVTISCGRLEKLAVELLSTPLGEISSARFEPDGHVLVTITAPGAPPTLFRAGEPPKKATKIGFVGSELLSVSRTGRVALGLEFHRSGIQEASKGNLIIEDTPLAALAVVDSRLGAGGFQKLVGDVECADWGGDEQLAVVRPAKSQTPGEFASTMLEWPIGKPRYKTDPQPITFPNAPGLQSRWPYTLTDLRMAPDNHHVAAIERQLPSSPEGDIVAIDLASGKKMTLLSGLSEARGLAWSADGRKVVFAGAFSGGDLCLQDVDLAGKPLLHALSGLHTRLARFAVQDISSKGDLLLSAVGGYECGVRACDLQGGSQRVFLRQESPLDSSGAPSGGVSIVLAELTDAGESAVVIAVPLGTHAEESTVSSYVQRADGTRVMRLDGLMATSLSPDGKSVVAVSQGGELFVVPVSDPPNRLHIALPGLRAEAARWFHDGRRVLLAADRAEKMGLYVLDLRGGTPVLISRHGAALVTGGSSMFCAAISADDKYVAALDSSYHTVIVASDGSSEGAVPGNAEERTSPLFTWLQFYEPLRWSPDSQSLYMLDSNRTAVERVSLESGERQTIVTLGRPTVGVEPLSVEITADGKTCAYTYMSPMSQLFRVTSGAW